MNEQEYIQSGAVEACILGVATTEEMAEFARMKAQYPAVKAAADLFEQQLEQQAMAHAIAPPAAARAQVMQRIAAGQAEAPVIPMQQQAVAGTAPVKPLWWRYAAAASVAVMLASVAFNFILAKKVKNLQQEVLLAKNTITQPPNGNDAQFAFMQNPAITPVAMYGVDIHKVCRCTLFWDQEHKKAYLVVHHLFTPPDDKDYQLWAMINGKPVSAGIINATNLKKPIPLDNIPEGAGGFAVTLEDKGGKPQPNLEQLYLSGKII